MVDPVQGPSGPSSAAQGPSNASAADPASQNGQAPVPLSRQDRFSKSMIAAALRAPMINLTDNGPDDDRDPPTIPMKAPIITKAAT